MRRKRTSRIGLRHAGRGLAWALRNQRNLRIEAMIGSAALAVATWLEAPLAPVLLACGLVLAAELMNTAVEELVNLIRPEHDPLAGRVKDVAAACVLLAVAVAVGVGLALLGPPLLERLGGIAA